MYRNLSLTLMKQFFSGQLECPKNISKGVKTVISQDSIIIYPTSIAENDKTLIPKNLQIFLTITLRKLP